MVPFGHSKVGNLQTKNSAATREAPTTASAVPAALEVAYMEGSQNYGYLFGIPIIRTIVY